MVVIDNFVSLKMCLLNVLFIQLFKHGTCVFRDLCCTDLNWTDKTRLLYLSYTKPEVAFNFYKLKSITTRSFSGKLLNKK